MITEWFMGIFAPVAQWFLGLFGDGEPPAWLLEVVPFVNDVLARVAGLGAWVPFPLLGTVTVAVFGLWAGFWLVKGIRWLWGLTPFSGGS